MKYRLTSGYNFVMNIISLAAFLNRSRASSHWFLSLPGCLSIVLGCAGAEGEALAMASNQQWECGGGRGKWVVATLTGDPDDARSLGIALMIRAPTR